MSGLDFFVDLTVTGTVLGLDHTSDRDAVHAVFGGEVVPPLVDVDDLRKAVAGQGFPLEERQYHDGYHVEFWSPVSNLSVLAERSSRDVMKLLGPARHSPWRSFPDRFEMFASYARHLLPLPPHDRETWFDRRAENSAAWWGCLAAVSNHKNGGSPETAQQGRLLRLAMHRAATARGVYQPGEAAATEVGLLLDARLAPDDAVRRWLATAVMPAPDDVRAARLLRDRIHEVQRALRSLTEPDLVAKLGEWCTVKPNLLAG